MANHLRGEVDALLGGSRYTLCLTLNALAELEHRLGVESMASLLARFQGDAVRANDLLDLLVSGLKAYHTSISDEDAHVLLSQTKPAHLIKLAADLVEATFSDETPQRPFEQA